MNAEKGRSMPEPGKVFDLPYGRTVFVSHTHADHEHCKPLRQALESWNVAYWYDSQDTRIGHRLLDELLTNVRKSDILLRVCTPAAVQSAWMHRELGMFLAFQQERAPQCPACNQDYQHLLRWVRTRDHRQGLLVHRRRVLA